MQFNIYLKETVKNYLPIVIEIVQGHHIYYRNRTFVILTSGKKVRLRLLNFLGKINKY